MVRYRRSRVPGGTYFFTVTLRDRRSTVLTDHIDLLRDAFRMVRTRRPFEIEAIVVLPEHLHTVVILPDGDDDYSGRWRAIKSAFTRSLRKQRNASVCVFSDVWQARFWEHTIASETDLQRHIDYVHWNPVKHKFVSRVTDWPYSSFHRYVRRGLLPPDWAGGGWVSGTRGFGE